MSHLVDPIEASAEQASFQSFFGRTSSSNRIEDIGLQFLAIVRSRSSCVCCNLGPNELCRIQLRRSDRKVEHVQSFMLCQKTLDHLTLVDGMAIPDQDDGTGHSIKNLSKESNYLFACQTMPVRTDTQTNSFAFRRDQQCSQQVETLVMIDGSLPDRGLATPRPGPFERRNQRKTAFIFQNEGSAQLATLFLSWAVPLSSIAR